MFESTFAFKVADICPDPEEYPNDVVADITATIPYPAEAAYPDAFGIAKYTITYDIQTFQHSNIPSDRKSVV